MYQTNSNSLIDYIRYFGFIGLSTVYNTYMQIVLYAVVIGLYWAKVISTIKSLLLLLHTPMLTVNFSVAMDLHNAMYVCHSLPMQNHTLFSNPKYKRNM